MSDKEIREYIAFMNDPANIHKCHSCPANRNIESFDAYLPCGQQNCWVVCHCKIKEREVIE